MIHRNLRQLPFWTPHFPNAAQHTRHRKFWNRQRFTRKIKQQRIRYDESQVTCNWAWKDNYIFMVQWILSCQCHLSVISQKSYIPQESQGFQFNHYLSFPSLPACLLLFSFASCCLCWHSFVCAVSSTKNRSYECTAQGACNKRALCV